MKHLRKKMSEVAIEQCVTELRAACRRPIDQSALDTLLTQLRPNFERVLDDPDGRTRWAEHGRQLRDNGRYIGALADFLAYHANVDTVSAKQLGSAFELVSTACRVGSQPPPPIGDTTPAEKYLRSL